MKLKHIATVAAVLALVLVPAISHAQNGCVDSPENPTALLALVGGVSGVFAMLRSKR